VVTPSGARVRDGRVDRGAGRATTRPETVTLST
jgi:hypothetical protein